jgi:hypothetical protein
MTTFGITRVKGDTDIIGETIAWMLTQVDHIMVKDGGPAPTSEILRSFPITVLPDDTPTYAQPQEMTDLADQARELGADWVVPFDADEIWHADEGRIADQLAELPDNILIADAALLDHRATSEDDPLEPNPIKRLRWRMTEPLPLRKVACRARAGLTIHPGNHGAAFIGVRRPARVADVLGARHFPYRSDEQFIEKIAVGSPALLDDAEAPEGMGAHWRQYGQTLRDHGPKALRDHFYRWFYIDDPENDPQVVLDPCPPYSSPSPEPALIAEQP